MRALLLLSALLVLLLPQPSRAGTGSDPFGLLSLPNEYRTKRSTVQKYIQPLETLELANISGAGCLKHFWLTFNNAPETTELGLSLILRIYVDGSEMPSVEMPAAVFFAQFHGLAPGYINGPFMQVTDQGGFNSYFPIPFSDGLRMTLENETEGGWDIYFQGDYHQYESLEEPLRFHAVWRRENPGDVYGLPYHVGRAKGRGYIAAMALGMRVTDRTDAWYHCGGESIIIDAGTESPILIGGIGGEDFFGTAYGMETFSNGPVGSAYYLDWTHEEDREPHVIFSAHRFFHPDHLRFEESFWFDFGARRNDITSVLYWYQDSLAEPFARPLPPEDRAADAQVPRGKHDVALVGERTWDVVGPFPAETREEFEREEFPETSLDFEQRAPANFGDYGFAVSQGYPQEFTKWTRGVSSFFHMVDLRPYNRHKMPSNFAMPRNASAYARTVLEEPGARTARFRVGHDDWLRLWINGELVYDGEKRAEFGTTEIEVELSAGENVVLVKSAVHENFNMRMWMFQFREVDR